MVNELIWTEEAACLQASAVARLVKNAPPGTKCIFLNCEMRDSPSGIVMSDDLFAVVKPLLGKAKRVTLDLDADTFKLLAALGRQLMADPKGELILDLVIDSKGRCKAFKGDGPLNRLGGGQRSFNTKHKGYVQIEPWLAEVE